MFTSASFSLRRTPLHELHVDRGGRMMPFAEYEMPLSFRGAVDEHLHTRRQASLFDVSHMRVCDVVGDEAMAGLERLTPSRVSDLSPASSRYLTLTNAMGGVIDDLIVTRMDDRLRLVLNASRVTTDLRHLRAHLGSAVREREDLGLLALQGPMAVTVLEDLSVDVAGLAFMHARPSLLAGVEIQLSRSGYTGEDGFELTAAAVRLREVAECLLGHDAVQLAGLAARDSLRLEAGLCLYGQELDESTSPVEAGLVWTIPRDRRQGGDYLGAATVAAQVRDGAPRRLVGLRPAGRRPLRPGATLHTVAGDEVGVVTSGGWGPSVGGPVAMGYTRSFVAGRGTPLLADVRGHVEPCEVVRLPFVPHRYVREPGGAA